MQQTESREGHAFLQVRRRDLLLGLATTALVAGVAIGGGGRLLAAPAPIRVSPAFVDMSRFVTGSSLLDDATVLRAWNQLLELDAGFPDAVERLRSAVRAAKLADMKAMLASPLGKDGALMATVRTITATWYLGYTGEKTGFVTFAGALMWRPTIDATVIPTYSRGATDFWVDPPAGTPAPKGPAGIREWRGATPSTHS
jgi:hypothetical protein